MARSETAISIHPPRTKGQKRVTSLLTAILYQLQPTYYRPNESNVLEKASTGMLLRTRRVLQMYGVWSAQQLCHNDTRGINKFESIPLTESVEMQWSLSKASASSDLGPATIEVHPQEPQQYSRCQLGGISGLSWRFAAIQPLPRHACVPTEIYTRQLDLIAKYQQSADDSFAFQLDWQLQAASGPFAGGVELWVSVQTNLLDVEPELQISCLALDKCDWQMLSHADLTGQRTLEDASHGPAAIVTTASSHAGATGVWLIEESDQRHARIVSQPSDVEMRVRLLGHFMEKGVIRRARMRFLLADGQVTRDQIAAAYSQFANSPLPLTA